MCDTCAHPQVAHYWALLERVVLRLGAARHGHVPELYMVPRDCIDAERRERGSQRRVPAGECPHLWSQSLYVLCQLLMEGLLSPAELDPLSRRLCFTDKPPPTEVQGEWLSANTFHIFVLSRLSGRIAFGARQTRATRCTRAVGERTRPGLFATAGLGACAYTEPCRPIGQDALDRTTARSGCGCVLGAYKSHARVCPRPTVDE
jgi:hypothetical protein